MMRGRYPVNEELGGTAWGKLWMPSDWLPGGKPMENHGSGR